MRLTVAQALVRFLAAQLSERDGGEQRLIPGCFGIFGHGNVAGVGQALLEESEAMPYRPERGRPDSGAWWDVPVAEVAALAATRPARATCEASKAAQKTFLKTPETVRTA